MPENGNGRSSKEATDTGRGLALSLISGTALGLVMWLVTDTIAFFPIFVGAGISIGLAIGVARDKEEHE
jgi:F0F1-type ATP synthase assembly protein I